MRALVRPVLLAAAAAATLAGGTAAEAACAGTANTSVFCVTVNPGGLPSVDPFGSSYDDCIYVVNPPCVPVSVPIPTVTPGSGQVADLGCGGPLIDPWLACR